VIEIESEIFQVVVHHIAIVQLHDVIAHRAIPCEFNDSVHYSVAVILWDHNVVFQHEDGRIPGHSADMLPHALVVDENAQTLIIRQLRRGHL